MEDKKGLFLDPEGDVSSGRVVKVYAFVTAVLVTIVGLAIVTYLALHGLPAGELISYVATVDGMFLGVAAGTEVVQKLTGK